MSKQRPLGVVMADIKGLEIDPVERDMLGHPDVGGVILFARNYESPEQLRRLTRSIREIRDPNLLIAVDHEGGRVQRFRSGFTTIPSMGTLGRLHQAGGDASALARAIGYLIANELATHGLDFSFTPVLDLDYGESTVIGDRAFSRDPEVVGLLADYLIQGLRANGVAAVGKHFPGHGYVRADSHLEVPIDERSMSELEQDIAPYRRVIPSGLAGLMPAHVIYPNIDEMPAGFSSRWLRDILRGELAFQGMIFSDDLSMEGACIAGDIEDRAWAALNAGCDIVLVCNAPDSAAKLLDASLGIRLSAERETLMRAKILERTTSDYAQALSVLRRVEDDYSDLFGASSLQS